MGPKSAALNSLQITLGRWQNPSAWDRVIQDEPLDPVPQQFVSDTACNVSSNGIITIPIGTAVTNANGDTFRVMAGYSETHANFGALVTQHLVEEERMRALAGMPIGGNPTDTPFTGNPYGNTPASPAQRQGLPYPRNHHERRIYKSFERNILKLNRLIRRAEEKFGLPKPGHTDEWNDKFWKMVSHVARDERRKIK